MDTSFLVGIFVDMVGVESKQECVLITANSSNTDFDGACASVLATSKKCLTIYDVGFDKGVARYEQITGEYLEVNVDLLGSDQPYNVWSRHNRTNSQNDVFKHADFRGHGGIAGGHHEKSCKSTCVLLVTTIQGLVKKVSERHREGRKFG